ncbi:hypothetical protein C8J57DRAFT_1219945 [Mycena rebaudengoi]|nr:hypothetical protein C8J57DRAFT_1219945 [Mycena rebaudengoi]
MPPFRAPFRNIPLPFILTWRLFQAPTCDSTHALNFQFDTTQMVNFCAATVCKIFAFRSSVLTIAGGLGENEIAVVGAYDGSRQCAPFLYAELHDCAVSIIFSRTPVIARRQTQPLGRNLTFRGEGMLVAVTVEEVGRRLASKDKEVICVMGSEEKRWVVDRITRLFYTFFIAIFLLGG